MRDTRSRTSSGPRRFMGGAAISANRTAPSLRTVSVSKTIGSPPFSFIQLRFRLAPVVVHPPVAYERLRVAPAQDALALVCAREPRTHSPPAIEGSSWGSPEPARQASGVQQRRQALSVRATSSGYRSPQAGK